MKAIVTALSLIFVTAGCSPDASPPRTLSISERVDRSLADASFTSRNDDVGRFVLQHLGKGDIHPQDGASLPAVVCDWDLSEGSDGVLIPESSDGFIIRMPRKEYPSIESFLRQAFGQPSSTFAGDPNQTGDTLDFYVLYRLSPTTQLQCGHNRDQTLMVAIFPKGESR